MDTQHAAGSGSAAGVAESVGANRPRYESAGRVDCLPHSLPDESPLPGSTDLSMERAANESPSLPTGKLRSAGYVGLLLTQFFGAFNDNMFRWLVVPIGWVRICAGGTWQGYMGE